MSRTELYDAYCEYYSDEERDNARLTANGFYSNLREKGFGEKKVAGTRYFMDIGFQKAETDPDELPF